VQVTRQQNRGAAAVGKDGGAAVMASGLRKAFGEVVALADLTLTVRYGSVVSWRAARAASRPPSCRSELRQPCLFLTERDGCSYDGQTARELV
jgi:hypothetical protein